MMKIILFTAITCILVSCSRRDEQFCECLEASKQLNDFSSELMNKKEPLEADKPKLRKLQKQKKAACENYKTLSAQETSEKRRNCN